MLDKILLAQADVLPNGGTEATLTTEGDVLGILLPILGVVFVAMVVIIAAIWKVLIKAGKPGWIALVPVYNAWILFEIAGRPGWWSLVSLAGAIPIIGFFAGPVYLVLALIAYIDLAKSFGKGSGFGALLTFLPIIGFPMLGFGSAQYQGPAGPEKGASNSNNFNQPSAPLPQTPNQPGGLPPSPYAQSVQAQEQPQQPATVQPSEGIQPPQPQPPQQPQQPQQFVQPQTPQSQPQQPQQVVQPQSQDNDQNQAPPSQPFA